MADFTLAAQERTEFGKGAARRVRRSGLTPATLYDHKAKPIHVSLPTHDTFMALRQANALLEIAIEGDQTYLALPREVQRDRVHDVIEHVDLVVVKLGEKVEVEVPLHLEGEPVTGMAFLDTSTILLLVEATNIPERIVVAAEALNEGDIVRASDLPLPEGAALAADPDTLILSVSGARTDAQQDALEGVEAVEAEPGE